MVQSVSFDVQRPPLPFSTAVVLGREIRELLFLYKTQNENCSLEHSLSEHMHAHFMTSSLVNTFQETMKTKNSFHLSFYMIFCFSLLLFPISL